METKKRVVAIDEATQEKPRKAKNGSGPSFPVRIKMTTKQKIDGILCKANQKKFGRKIKVCELIDLAVGCLTDEHIQSLQQSALSNKDRLDMLLAERAADNPSLSKDDLLGLLLCEKLNTPKKIAKRTGKLRQSTKKSDASSNEKVANVESGKEMLEVVR